MASVQLGVEPPSALIDDVLHIRASGLRPSQPVTIVARVKDDGGRFYACAHYTSDEQGVVDVASMPSQGGHYEGVQVMGLMCHMRQEPGQKAGRRLMKKDVTSPLVTFLFLLNGHKSCDTLLDERWELPMTEIVSTCHVERWYKAEGVERVVLDEGRLMGTLFLPPGEGPFPGVLELFGTIGGTVEHRSALLASRGFASLALCYFTFGQGPGLITDLEYFEEAIDWLMRQPKVSSRGVGAIGVSKGAEMVLMLASLCPNKIKACVEINGVHIVTLCEITYQGETYPDHCLELTEDDVVTESPLPDDIGDGGDCAIPLERAMCPFLLIHGEDDKNVTPITGEHIGRRLQLRDPPSYQPLVYPGAGHLLEPPYSPLFRTTFNPMYQRLVTWGGNPLQHAQAQADSWKRILEFFRLNIPTVSKL